eukprot:6303835-Ditylum_brightwellii.AAC.1
MFGRELPLHFNASFRIWFRWDISGWSCGDLASLGVPVMVTLTPFIPVIIWTEKSSKWIPGKHADIADGSVRTAVAERAKPAETVMCSSHSTLMS